MLAQDFIRTLEQSSGHRLMKMRRVYNELQGGSDDGVLEFLGGLMKWHTRITAHRSDYIYLPKNPWKLGFFGIIGQTVADRDFDRTMPDLIEEGKQYVVDDFSDKLLQFKNKLQDRLREKAKVIAASVADGKEEKISEYTEFLMNLYENNQEAKNGFDLKDKQGQTSLIHAAFNGLVRYVKMLLDYGATPTYRTTTAAQLSCML